MERSVSAWVAHVELAGRLEPVGVLRAPSSTDETARVLVRLHGDPLGFVELPLPLREEDITAAVCDRLSVPLRRHLDADGIAMPDQLPVAGVDDGARCSDPWPSPPHERLSVVVCTRNNPTGLAGGLRQLQHLRHSDFEVVVVDNAPMTDETREAFTAVVGADRRFRYAREPVPGLSVARNRGLAEAACKHVAFTDDDAVVDPSWLDAIARGFGRDPRVGCVTGLVPGAELDHPAQIYFDRRYSWTTGMTRRIFDSSRPPDLSPDYPYSAGVFGTGANLAVDRDLMQELGGFDPSLGAGTPSGGGEDLDAFVRIINAGRAIAYEPSAIVWHVHRSNDRDLRRQLFYYGAGLTAFLTKHMVDARTGRGLVARIPSGARRLRRAWHADAISGRAPAALVGMEALGMAAGPLLYAQGRRRWRAASS